MWTLQDKVSLMSHTSITKLLLRIIMQRVKNKVRPEISNTQIYFVADIGILNAIFNLSMIKAFHPNEDGCKLYKCAKAFD